MYGIFADWQTRARDLYAGQMSAGSGLPPGLERHPMGRGGIQKRQKRSPKPDEYLVHCWCIVRASNSARLAEQIPI